MTYQSTSSFEHIFFSCSSNIFIYQLDFSLLTTESSVIFRHVSEFLAVSQSFLDAVNAAKGNKLTEQIFHKHFLVSPMKLVPNWSRG